MIKNMKLIEYQIFFGQNKKIKLNVKMKINNFIYKLKKNYKYKKL